MAKLDLGLPRYMGRGIGYGFTSQGEPAVFYFAEGRSPPSRERKLWMPEGEGGQRVYMDVNSRTSIGEMVASGGNPDLLLYNAMYVVSRGLCVVSNGFQTDCDPVWEGSGREKENLKGSTPGHGILYRLAARVFLASTNETSVSMYKAAISESLSECCSEVDPIRTARIALAADMKRPDEAAAIGVVIRPRRNGVLEAEDRLSVVRAPFTGKKGQFTIFATYGVHDPPYHLAEPPEISAVTGWTRIIGLDSTTPEQMVLELYEALPKELLVGVASGMLDSSSPSGFRLRTKNTQE